MRGRFGGWGGLYPPLNTHLYTRVGKGTEDSVHDSTHNRGVGGGGISNLIMVGGAVASWLVCWILELVARV